MATNTTSKYLNQDKRESEAITVTLPAVSNIGGGRAQRSPVYNQFAEEYVAYVVPAGSIVQKAYVIIEEAMPAGALLEVTVGGTVVATGVLADAVAMTVAGTEDLWFPNDTNIKMVVTGGTGDILTGIAKVVVETIPYNEKNGRYSSFPHANDHKQAR